VDRLEAIFASRRCFRAYEIAVGTDLFGTWMVKWRGRHFTICTNPLRGNCVFSTLIFPRMASTRH
jgi:hypothetical protein